MKVHTEVACISLMEVAVSFKIEVMFSLKKDAIGMAPAFARLHKQDGSGVRHLQESAASGS